ncbi:flavin-containing monooxygenase [Krasilnikovia sp. M28-CT-15]|uniref:flavin-containing monooxygenase n=1 Tax=Krasilnikovia sp. M28-CT-15 TaxID=3373540 RepID=UPI00399C5B09
MSTTMDLRDRYAVIGAGPSGLAAARNLMAEGVACEVLEAHDGVGGIWDRANPRSSVYANTHTITSKKVTEYPDLPLDADLPTYPRHDAILDYLRAYAAHFDLTPHIRFGQEVTAVTPDGEHWIVATADGTSRRYRGVVLANGHNWKPRFPQYAGSFDGTTMHSRDYDTAADFTGKRVLVVGAGNSGCDIAVEAAQTAESVAISMRRGYYFVPKYILGKPADQVGDASQSLRLPIGLVRRMYKLVLRATVGRPQDYGLPVPDHKLLESPPIVNSLLPYYVGHGRVKVRPEIKELHGDKVEFTDGQVDAVDVIVYATGFQVHLPGLDPEHLSWRNGRPDLYLMAFSRRHDNLFVAGLTDGTGGHFPTVDLQTKVIAKFVAGRDRGGAAAADLARRKANDHPDVSGGIKFIDSPRSLTQFELHTYLRQLRRHLDELS